jgi:hypothetical protein
MAECVDAFDGEESQGGGLAVMRNDGRREEAYVSNA